MSHSSLAIGSRGMCLPPTRSPPSMHLAGVATPSPSPIPTIPVTHVVPTCSCDALRPSRASRTRHCKSTHQLPVRRACVCVWGAAWVPRPENLWNMHSSISKCAKLYLVTNKYLLGYLRLAFPCCGYGFFSVSAVG